ncbi:hypothetical protein ACFLQR_05110, partial [Verrucomicrobiota bacterium]
MRTRISLFFALVFLLSVSSSFGDAPEMFNHQGRLIINGEVANGITNMIFTLTNATDVVYVETQAVDVVSGLYSVMIGPTSTSWSLTQALTNEYVYLQLTVGTNTLSPSERLVAVPYALRIATNTVGSSEIVDDTIINADISASAAIEASKLNLTVTTDASGLTNLNASYLASGTVSNTQLDADLQTLAVNDGGSVTNISAANIASNTVVTAIDGGAITNLSAANLAAGTVA